MAEVIAGLSAKQLAERDGPEGFIGGSEIATLAGHGYGTLIDLWRRKTRRIGQLEETRRMTWGNVLEAPIASLWAREQQVSIFRAGTMRHPDYPFIGATPDRIVIPNPKARAREHWIGTLQVKVRGARRAEEYADGGYPMSDYDQVQWELLVTALQKGYLAALVGGNEDVQREIPADPAYQAGLVSICEDFWKNYVLADKEPPPDGSEDYAAHIRSKYPRADATMLDPTEATQAMRRAYVMASRLENQAKATKEQVKQQLQMIIGEAGGITDVCTWRQTKPTTVVDVEAALDRVCQSFAIDKQVLLRDFTKTVPGGRTFRIKKHKDDEQDQNSEQANPQAEG